jgi:hypothetical protein
MSAATRPPHAVLDQLVAGLEEQFGGRWSDVWIESRGDIETLFVGIVEPTAQDVLDIQGRCADQGWVASVVGMRYSLKEREKFRDMIVEEVMSPGDGHVIAVGAQNLFAPGKVWVQINERDRQTVQRLLSLVPSDALAIDIRPGAGYTTLGS